MIESIKDFLEEYPLASGGIKIFGIFVLALISYIITRKIIISILRSIIKKTKTKYDDIFLNENVLKRLAFLAPILVINQFSEAFSQVNKFVANTTGSYYYSSDRKLT